MDLKDKEKVVKVIGAAERIFRAAKPVSAGTFAVLEIALLCNW